MTWRVVRLGDVADTASGSTPPRGRRDYFDGSIPWAKIQDLTRSGMWLRDTDERVSPSAVRDRRLPLFEVGTVLLAMYGSIGTVSIASVPTTANQAILGISPSGRLDSKYLWFFLRHYSQDLARLGRGGTQANINAPIVRDIRIPLPPVVEQRRIAADLGEHLARVSEARASAMEVGSLARRLGLSILAGVFRLGSREWPRRRLGEITDTGRSASIRSDGDTAVLTVTSGCLTPFGFTLDGLGFGRMSSVDAFDSVVAAGEVLVSRSNTEALVGRASVYPGGARSVVASDLVFRLVPESSSLHPDFLAGYLSVLQLEGYWRHRSSGASSTMKKITKTLLLNVEIPLPPLQEQLRVTAELRERLASINALETAIRAERAAIEALSAALLRRAFADLAA